MINIRLGKKPNCILFFRGKASFFIYLRSSIRERVNVFSTAWRVRINMVPFYSNLGSNRR